MLGDVSGVSLRAPFFGAAGESNHHCVHAASNTLFRCRSQRLVCSITIYRVMHLMSSMKGVASRGPIKNAKAGGERDFAGMGDATTRAVLCTAYFVHTYAAAEPSIARSYTVRCSPRLCPRSHWAMPRSTPESIWMKETFAGSLPCLCNETNPSQISQSLACTCGLRNSSLSS